MSSNLTLEILSDYFFNYTKLHQPDIERYEIEDFLDEWLDRIQAPKDARGIMLVLKNINESNHRPLPCQGVMIITRSYAGQPLSQPIRH